VKAGNPTECAAVNWNVCKSAVTLYCLSLNMIERNCNQSANKSELELVTLHMTL
jgi:hypothetical protein